MVSNTHNEAIAGHVRAGARLLLLPEAEGALHPFFPHWQNVKIRARAGYALDRATGRPRSRG